ncbi:MAG: hypothetical protein HUJ63_13060 [Enterococcus sp.]|nr:hypothetical protein [Enterococcus sp.]
MEYGVDVEPAELLEAAYASGRLAEIGPSDFHRLAADALDRDESLTDAGRLSAYEAAVRMYAAEAAAADAAAVSGYFGGVEDAYHGDNAAAVASVSGMGERAYEIAEAAKAAGDPSPMLAVRSAFLSRL